MCPIPSKLGIVLCHKTFQSLHACLLESSPFQDIWAAFLTLSTSKKFLLSVILPKGASHKCGSQCHLMSLVLSEQHSKMTHLGLASICLSHACFKDLEDIPHPSDSLNGKVVLDFRQT